MFFVINHTQIKWPNVFVFCFFNLTKTNIIYNRRDERCLVQSGLLELLDKLCAYQVKNKKQESNNVGPLAWSSFQVSWKLKIIDYIDNLPYYIDTKSFLN
jgi:hypothetical protein